jgi:2-C-methyl-D-erythritol 4-phosphate cytidylyltransferase / 2-C-methyl-D-erythritol 2,4-cyclodiphosphate synthase
MFKIGNGFDVHKFEKGKPLVLGGIRIDYDYGLKAHSDGDVVIHSVIDSILGACGLGDIGDHFPDSNIKYKNICSEVLLKSIIQKISVNYVIKNIDVTIICEKPNLLMYKSSIKKNLANLCGINDNDVNIKATTMEKMGDIGKGKGIAVLSTCLIENIN